MVTIDRLENAWDEQASARGCVRDSIGHEHRSSCPWHPDASQSKTAVNVYQAFQSSETNDDFMTSSVEGDTAVHASQSAGARLRRHVLATHNACRRLPHDDAVLIAVPSMLTLFKTGVDIPSFSTDNDSPTFFPLPPFPAYLLPFPPFLIVSLPPSQLSLTSTHDGPPPLHHHGPPTHVGAHRLRCRVYVPITSHELLGSATAS